MSEKDKKFYSTLALVTMFIIMSIYAIINLVIMHRNKSSVEEHKVVVEQDEISPLTGDQVVTKVDSYESCIEFPRLGIMAYVYDGVSKEHLNKGVVRDENTSEIGGKGNCVIFGHSSSIYNCVFNGLEQAEVGEEFYLYDKNGNKLHYEVYDVFVVNASQVEILEQTDEDIVTVYTCTERGARRRVLRAREMTFEKIKEKTGIFSNVYHSKVGGELLELQQVKESSSGGTAGFNREGVEQTSNPLNSPMGYSRGGYRFSVILRDFTSNMGSSHTFGNSLYFLRVD